MRRNLVTQGPSHKRRGEHITRAGMHESKRASRRSGGASLEVLDELGFGRSARLDGVEEAGVRVDNVQYHSSQPWPFPSSIMLGFYARGVTEEITMKRYPALGRYGARAGKVNPDFLNADLFASRFLGPMESFRDRTGVLIFEFARFRPGDWERGAEFVAAMDSFLSKLPAGWQYGVEIRNRSFLEAPWFACLARHRVAHVYNSWQHMPGLAEQLEMPGSLTTDFTAARLLLKPGRAYEEAVSMFSPYAGIREPLPEVRSSAAELLLKLRRAALPAARHSFVYVNNRLEGNALETIQAISRELAAREVKKGPDATVKTE